MTRIDDTLLRDRLETAIRDHDQVFERFFLARFLDLSFAYLPEVAPDADKTVCRVTFPVTPLILNPQGVVHGGVLATVMDVSMGHLLAKIAGPAATIEMKVQYMRPASEGPLACEGRFTKRGRQISFMESEVTGPGGLRIAHATATWKMP